MNTNSAYRVQDVFSETIESAGFVKRVDSWYLDGPETVRVANLQKSQWGKQWYVNLAIWVKALGIHEFPKEHECHLRTRLTSLAGENRKELERALDAEDTSLTAIQRTEPVRAALETSGLAWLSECSTLAGIAAAQNEGRLRATMVHRRLKELLAGNPGTEQSV